MKVSFVFPNPSMPRTAFWDLFVDALKENPRYVEDASAADVLFPAEDTALESNWPRYGDGAKAFTRGVWVPEQYRAYMRLLGGYNRPLCVVNMNPFTRVSQSFKDNPFLYVADISLSAQERLENPRTISMPVLPITVGQVGPQQDRPILASFRGALSHPCRQPLLDLHDGESFVCQSVDASNHVGRIDAQNKVFDSAFINLFEQSSFAFAPRGDALFSYRLPEAMSFGCIPVILADGWVLPFDRCVDWSTIALHMPEADASRAKEILSAFSAEQITAMRQNMLATWEARFAQMPVIIEGLLQELEMLIENHQR